MELTQKKCVPCEGKISPMNENEEHKFLKEVDGWDLIKEGTHKIRKEFKFKNFKKAMKFVNQVAEIAEGEGHHPDIYIYYNKVVLELYTHAVGGLFENDFIIAAKVDGLIEE